MKGNVLLLPDSLSQYIFHQPQRLLPKNHSPFILTRNFEDLLFFVEECKLDEKIENVGADKKLGNGIAQYMDEDEDNENIYGNGLVGDTDEGAVTDGELQGISNGVGRVPDVRFDAFVIQDQRILDDDLDVIRFNDKRSETETKMDSPDTTCAGYSRGGGWQFQNPSRIKQRIKRRIQRELNSEDVMSDEEANQVSFSSLVAALIVCNLVTNVKSPFCT